MRALVVLFVLIAGAAQAAPPSPYASISEQRGALAEGAATSIQLVDAYLERIQRIDRRGPNLNSVLALNPKARDQARALDAERQLGKAAGLLQGVPILVKDNIETADLPTTAGSLALRRNNTGRDAPVVSRLVDAGAVILGKTNLSEWANFRSTTSINGWSAVAGRVRNPYALNRSTCGSSAGSAVAVAAGLAAAAIGTETDGSITCPAAMTGIVGLKPTVGLVSRTHMVPISPEQDTAGPMTRSVTDAAILLTVMAGTDAADPATKQADARKTNYLSALNRRALRGVRIGAWNPYRGRSPETDAVFEHALETLEAQGAVIVRVRGVESDDLDKISPYEVTALHSEFRAALDAYLATTPEAVSTRSLKEVIAFNTDTPREMQLFGQEILEASERAPALNDPAYQQARATARKLATEALDRMLADRRLAAIVAPSAGPAEVTDLRGDGRWLGSPSLLPAVSGTPHLTVPMGQALGMPVGLSFLGPAWSEARLLGLGFAFEQAAKARRQPEFRPSVVVHPYAAFIGEDP